MTTLIERRAEISRTYGDEDIQYVIADLQKGRAAARADGAVGVINLHTSFLSDADLGGDDFTVFEVVYQSPENDTDRHAREAEQAIAKAQRKLQYLRLKAEFEG